MRRKRHKRRWWRPSWEALFLTGLGLFVVVIFGALGLSTWDRAERYGGWDRYLRASYRTVEVCEPRDGRTVCWDETWTYIDGERVR